MTIVLDLNRRHWTVHRGPLTFIGTWLRTPERWMPCMAFMRTSDEGKPEAQVCIITQDRAWIWSEDVGEPGQAAQQAFAFCQQLRIETADPLNVLRLGGWVHDLLGELLTIPPLLASDIDLSPVIAEVTITDQDGKSREVLLRDV